MNDYLDEIKKTNLVLSSMKTPKLNILKYNNINNINNIYNKNYFLKLDKISSNDKNNNKTIIINNKWERKKYHTKFIK